MRRLALLLVLWALPASAATYYVGTTGCSDSAAGTVYTAPLCTTAAALAKANAGSDNTVLLRAGATFSTNILKVTSTRQTWSSYDPATGLETTTRATLSSPGSDTTFRVGQNTGAIVPFPAGQEFTCRYIDFAVGSALQTRQGAGVIEIQSPGATLHHLSFSRPSASAETYSGAFALNIAHYNYDIHDITVTGKFVGFAVVGPAYVYYPNWPTGASQAACPSGLTETSCTEPTLRDPTTCGIPQWRGGTIHDVTVDYSMVPASGDQPIGCLMIQSPGDSRIPPEKKPVHDIYNLVCKYTAGSPYARESIYAREVTDLVYVHDSYFSGGAYGVLIQTGTGGGCKPGWGALGSISCAQCSGSTGLTLFNNVFVARDSSVLANSTAVRAIHCTQYDIVNNIFLNYDYGVEFAGWHESDADCRARFVYTDGGYSYSLGTAVKYRQGNLKNNLFYNGTTDGACQLVDASNKAICFTDSSTTHVDLMARSGNIYNTSFADLTRSNPSLTSDGHLGITSCTSPCAIDGGNNNPIRQGANTCSISGATSSARSCLVDADGNARPAGTGWEIGRDEIASGVVSPFILNRSGGASSPR